MVDANTEIKSYVTAFRNNFTKCKLDNEAVTKIIEFIFWSKDKAPIYTIEEILKYLEMCYLLNVLTINEARYLFTITLIVRREAKNGGKK